MIYLYIAHTSKTSKRAIRFHAGQVGLDLIHRASIKVVRPHGTRQNDGGGDHDPQFQQLIRNIYHHYTLLLLRGLRLQNHKYCDRIRIITHGWIVFG